MSEVTLKCFGRDLEKHCADTPEEHHGDEDERYEERFPDGIPARESVWLRPRERNRAEHSHEGHREEKRRFQHGLRLPESERGRFQCV